jgi:hypothetical protein
MWIGIAPKTVPPPSPVPVPIPIPTPIIFTTALNIDTIGFKLIYVPTNTEVMDLINGTIVYAEVC